MRMSREISPGVLAPRHILSSATSPENVKPSSEDPSDIGASGMPPELEANPQAGTAAPPLLDPDPVGTDGVVGSTPTKEPPAKRITPSLGVPIKAR